jgi:hypothetical protein
VVITPSEPNSALQILTKFSDAQLRIQLALGLLETEQVIVPDTAHNKCDRWTAPIKPAQLPELSTMWPTADL